MSSPPRRGGGDVGGDEEAERKAMEEEEEEEEEEADNNDDEDLFLLRSPAAANMKSTHVPRGRTLSVRVKLALLSQVLAVLLTLASISVQSLADARVNLPGTLNSFVYAALCVAYVPWYVRALHLHRRRGGGNSVVGEQRGGRWKYPLLALCDVEANFIIVFAYSYTSITSVTLLDFSTIPFAMILTRVFLHTRYSWGHVAGASTCVLGLAVLVLADMTSGGALEAGSRPILGDAMVVASALLYSTSNIIEEDLLRRGAARGKVLALLPLLALPLAATQASIFEHSRWAALASGGRVLGWVAGYVMSIFSFYSIAPYVLREGGSAAFNLAMITSDLWAALARVAMFGGFGSVKLAVGFSVALVLVAIGLVVYARAGDIHADERDDEGIGSGDGTTTTRSLVSAGSSSGNGYGSLRKGAARSTPMRTISP